MRFPRHKERASVILVALCFATVLAIALSSYLMLCFRSYSLSTRQGQFDRARQLAQIGLEEALWALNQNSWSSSGPAGTSAWATSGSNRTVTINYGVISQGATGVLALTVANYSGSAPTITAVSTLTLPSGATYARTLQATTKPAPLFGNSVATDNGIVRFYTNGTVDSYDSSVGAYGGANIGAAAVIAGTNITLTSATINGYAQTYGNSVVYTSGSGKVKALAGASMDTTRLGKSAYVPTFTVTEPVEASDYTGTLNNSSSQTIGNSGSSAFEYWYTDPSVAAGDLNLDGADTITVQGPVKLRVYNDLTMANNSRFNVTANGRLELYVDDDVSITTSNGIQNNTTGTRPKNIILFSTASRDGGRTFLYDTSAAFTGVIYSSKSGQSMTIDGGPTIRGAILGRGDINFSSGTTPVIHYDTDLRNLTTGWFTNVTTPFVINQVTEL